MARTISPETYQNQIIELTQRIEKHRKNIETLTAQKRALEDKQRNAEMSHLQTYMARNSLSVEQVISSLDAIAASAKPKKVHV